MSGCGDAGGDGTGSTGPNPTTVPGPTSDTTAELPTTSGTTEGGVTQGTVGMTGSTTVGTTSTPGTDTTAEATQGTTVGDTGTSTTTGAISGSMTDTSTSSSDTSTGTTDGPKLDMDGGCPPDNQATTFDYIWIANTTQVTVSKVNTKTGIEEGRYYTHPSMSGAEPSRTSVNQYGDVAVSNRTKGSVAKVMALKSKCIDKNNNGNIETSTGPNDVLPWGQDECVVWFTEFPAADGYYGGVRPTAWEGVKQDPNTCETPVPRLWIGYKDVAGTAHFARLHGDTGVQLDEVTRPGWTANSWGPYGGAVNSAGDLFTNGYDGEVSIRIDAQTLQIEELGLSPGNFKYGMGVDKHGNMWVGGFGSEHHLYFYDATAKVWQGMGNGGNAAGGALGVAVDDEDRVWGASSSPCRLIELDGMTKTWNNQNIVLPGCGSPWGVSIDNEGFVWVVDRANKAYKVDPDTYEIKLIVTGFVDPYTYSDMTGQGLQLVLPQ